MSDKKLREKADALIAFTQQGPRFIAWVQAVTDALAPATEKAKPGLKDSLWALLSSLRLWKSKGELAMHPSRLDGMIAAVLEDYGGVFIDAPAPKKVAKVETGTVPCPNCGVLGLDEYDHRKLDQFGTAFDKGGGFTCQPAPPEPAAPSWMKVSCMGDVDAGKEDLLCPPPDPKSCWVCRQHEEHCCPEPEPATPVAYTCPNCNRPTKSPNGHAISGATVFSPAEFTCKPAQPEPAAREMPEAVRDAVDTLRSGVPSYPTWRQYADTLESWWRNLAQPVAVGMTEELEHVLSIAERDLRYKEECFDNSARTVHDERIERLRAAIAAVRQQAAQGRKVALPKVRELLGFLKTDARAEFFPPLFAKYEPQFDAALAEIDAAEGKRTAGEHMSELSGEPLPHYLRDARLTANGMRKAAEIARTFRPQSACTCGGYISFHNGVPAHQPGCLVGECLEIADEINARADEIDETPDRWLAELDAAEGKGEGRG